MGENLQVVCLDAGGTLLRERSSRAEIYAEAAARRGRSIPPPGMAQLMYRAHRSLPLEVEGGFRYSDPWFRAFIRRIFVDELGLDAAELPGLEEELFGRFSDPGTFRLLEGALELLDGLRARGLAVAVLSNWSERLEPVLAGLGVARRVRLVLTSARERLEKPDPAFFRRALERLNASPSAALHAGDDLEKDVAGARAAGLTAVLVDLEDRHGEVDVPRVVRLPDLLTWIDGRWS